ncbi:zinc-dependent peptidase [Sphingobacterium sp. SRCM116780]|uniref:M90 family metallopeptidase n=1 Tax=Sphingobacterium sp. SRCM116780 TaxID=2907623 RepID=UPI001F2F6E74|nr:M90 family metallopeptidase [Sphingobacterium sp. SRCM116780]UIR54499.1 zinc-dependent peptidase [Sphingobacterium sp. SRCM116780]
MEKLFIIILVPVVIYLVYYLLNKTEKNSKAIRKVLSQEGKAILSKEVHYYQSLNDQDKIEFEERCLKFLDHVAVEGVGIDISLKDYMLVAASAIIPVFAFKNWEYSNLTTVLLYPNTFNQDYQFEGSSDRKILGMVGEGAMNGQMILSKSALEAGFLNTTDAQNTAIHEFVHLLDKTDGEVDGLPSFLVDHTYTLAWLEMIRKEIKKIGEGKSDIDPYGVTNRAEFFAVASEYFFENPDRLKAHHPELYKALSEVFKQDLTFS